ncbi:hypothetical protein F4825DRAFT_112486 [Nemania diffusa]|nr:hypothetical protein F4825DRAFT_112486 [Nemania diffusa]
MWDIAPGMDQWSKDEIYRHVGRSRKVQLSEDQGGGDLVEPVQFPNDLLRNTCRFGDFGHSILSGTVLENPCQRPLLFCAPERFHGVQPSDASDMWSFMCIVFELYTRVEIVYSDGLTFVHRLVGMLGPFPTHWRGHFVSAGAGQDWWYDHTGEMPRTQGDLITLEERLDCLRPEISRKERELALQVFRKGFEYLPEKRLTAAQLSEDPSFNALLAYYWRLYTRMKSHAFLREHLS